MKLSLQFSNASKWKYFKGGSANLPKKFDFSGGGRSLKNLKWNRIRYGGFEKCGFFEKVNTKVPMILIVVNFNAIYFQRHLKKAKNSTKLIFLKFLSQINSSIFSSIWQAHFSHPSSSKKTKYNSKAADYKPIEIQRYTDPSISTPKNPQVFFE